MTGLEYGEAFRRSSPFPASWGLPAGDDPFSEERAAWVLAKVRVHTRLKRMQELIRRETEMTEMLSL